MNKDYNQYKPTMPYPDQRAFQVVHFYNNGAVIESIPALNLTADDKKRLESLGAVSQTETRNEEYLEAKNAYGQHLSDLENQFINDLYEYHAVPRNVFTEALYGIAYDRGHSSGYSEVACIFQDLLHLIDKAKEAYGKN